MMMDPLLFDKGDAPCPTPGEVAAAQARRGTPRLRVPQRNQVEMRWASLDELIEFDHPVRTIWTAVCALDFRLWLGVIKAVEGEPGRDATDPRLLAALWIYATLEGIGSARELERLCEKHWAYQWLCGGVSVNHHMLSDFRSKGGEKWDALLTEIVASLLSENLVTMKRVAQDGMRVEANANEKTFRRRPRLEQFLEDARRQVETLRKLA
jgi:transposase